MLGPNIFKILNLPLSIQTHYHHLYLSLSFFTLNLYLIFYLSLSFILNSLSFLFFTFFKFYIYNSSFLLLLLKNWDIHQHKYKQSPCRFDTLTFEYFTTWNKLMHLPMSLLETNWCTCQWVNTLTVMVETDMMNDDNRFKIF